MKSADGFIKPDQASVSRETSVTFAADTPASSRSSSRQEKTDIDLVRPVEPALLRREIAALPASSRLVSSSRFDVFHARAPEIENILIEIGRLREITFSDIGEGTGQRIDIDRHDVFFTHLFLWDRESVAIAGAYRLGLSAEILPTQGVEGFYSAGSFQFHPRFFEELGPAIELGRSFIVRKYQRSFSALSLLWKGIGAFVSRNPHCASLFGPVSMSREYSQRSKRLLVDYFRTIGCQHHLAPFVQPRYRFETAHLRSCEDADEPAFQSFSALSKYISTLEPDGRSAPVLYRHYLAMGGEIVDFAIDKKFRDSLDGLIVINLLKANTHWIRHYMGKNEFDHFARLHHQNQHTRRKQKPGA